MRLLKAERGELIPATNLEVGKISEAEFTHRRGSDLLDRHRSFTGHRIFLYSGVWKRWHVAIGFKQEEGTSRVAALHVE